MQMQHYIGVKMIKARAMTHQEFLESKGAKFNPTDTPIEGYLVEYEDGYQSWSPREVFEKAYLPMGQIPTGMPNTNKITEQMVESFMGIPLALKVTDKTTLVKVIPKTGFEQFEVSSCVDPANYNHDIGTRAATRKIKDRMWGYLGFVLQWAKHGLTEVRKDNFMGGVGISAKDAFQPADYGLKQTERNNS